ncbi:hypothetical protein GZH46_01987 [Fragariocoptes setiger]|uniref:BBS7 platform domain-containing protein n=1 Tax=Fragariocoptes setiger TaxID=1670756 RepID=A0ABQ7S7U3_9ACAR|nr:hypothetical protein GZH46_01987 [Fragariocoptes setiger]
MTNRASLENVVFMILSNTNNVLAYELTRNSISLLSDLADGFDHIRAFNCQHVYDDIKFEWIICMQLMSDTKFVQYLIKATQTQVGQQKSSQGPTRQWTPTRVGDFVAKQCKLITMLQMFVCSSRLTSTDSTEDTDDCKRRSLEPLTVMAMSNSQLHFIEGSNFMAPLSLTSPCTCMIEYKESGINKNSQSFILYGLENGQVGLLTIHIGQSVIRAELSWIVDTVNGARGLCDPRMDLSTNDALVHWTNSRVKKIKLMATSADTLLILLDTPSTSVMRYKLACCDGAAQRKTYTEDNNNFDADFNDYMPLDEVNDFLKSSNQTTNITSQKLTKKKSTHNRISAREPTSMGAIKLLPSEWAIADLAYHSEYDIFLALTLTGLVVAISVPYNDNSSNINDISDKHRERVSIELAKNSLLATLRHDKYMNDRLVAIDNQCRDLHHNLTDIQNRIRWQDTTPVGTGQHVSLMTSTPLETEQLQQQRVKCRLQHHETLIGAHELQIECDQPMSEIIIVAVELDHVTILNPLELDEQHQQVLWLDKSFVSRQEAREANHHQTESQQTWARFWLKPGTFNARVPLSIDCESIQAKHCDARIEIYCVVGDDATMNINLTEYDSRTCYTTSLKIPVLAHHRQLSSFAQPRGHMLTLSGVARSTSINDRCINALTISGPISMNEARKWISTCFMATNNGIDSEQTNDVTTEFRLCSVLVDTELTITIQQDGCIKILSDNIVAVWLLRDLIMREATRQSKLINMDMQTDRQHLHYMLRRIRSKLAQLIAAFGVSQRHKDLVDNICNDLQSYNCNEPNTHTTNQALESLLDELNSGKYRFRASNSHSTSPVVCENIGVQKYSQMLIELFKVHENLMARSCTRLSTVTIDDINDDLANPRTIVDDSTATNAMAMRDYFKSGIAVLAIIGLTANMATITAGDLNYDTYFVEQNRMRMIKTSDSNYAIYNPDFGSDWRSVSVNGDQVAVVSKSNQLSNRPLATLSAMERAQLTNCKSQLDSIIINGPHGCGNPCKLTTFMRNGGTGSAGSGGSGSVSSYSNETMSVSVYGDDEFIAAKSTFPLDWQRLFYLKNIAGIVYKNGRVNIKPVSALDPQEKAQVNEVQSEVKKHKKSQSDLLSSLGNPFDFVRKSLGSFG